VICSQLFRALVTQWVINVFVSGLLDEIKAGSGQRKIWQIDYEAIRCRFSDLPIESREVLFDT